MALPILFSLCIAVNTWFIWFVLSKPLTNQGFGLIISLRRSGRYLTCRMTENRENALRRLTVVMLGQLAAVIFYIASVLILFSPSMVFAHSISDITAAFYSIEALAGMLIGIIAIAIGKDKT